MYIEIVYVYPYNRKHKVDKAGIVCPAENQRRKLIYGKQSNQGHLDW